ncbi:MAG: hypothetical protein AABZ39_07920 [Spirochaetota bacterium]
MNAMVSYFPFCCFLCNNNQFIQLLPHACAKDGAELAAAMDGPKPHASCVLARRPWHTDVLEGGAHGGAFAADRYAAQHPVCFSNPPPAGCENHCSSIFGCGYAALVHAFHDFVHLPFGAGGILYHHREHKE